MLSVLLVVAIMSLVMSQKGSSASPASECSCYTFDGFGSRSKEQQCTSEEGELVSMETLGEWKFIKTQIQNRRNDYQNEWWVGLEKRDGEWKWLSNHPLTYDKWQPGEPSTNDPRETCVVTAKNYPRNTYGLFNNAPCEMWKGLICEYKVQGSNCNDNTHARWCDERTSTAAPTSSPPPPPPAATTTTASAASVSTSTNVKQHTPKAAMTRPDGSAPKNRTINKKEKTPTASEHPKTQQEYTETSTATKPDNVATTKDPFTLIIIGALVPSVAVLLCCLVFCACRWKLKRKEKPRTKHKDTNGTDNCTVDVVPGSSSGFPVDEQEMKAIVIQPNPTCVQDDRHAIIHLQNSNDTKKVTNSSHGCLISPMTHDSLDVRDHKISVESTGRDLNQKKADSGICKDIRKSPQEHTHLQTPGDAVGKVPVIYATVDKGKEKNKDNKETEVVYAEVNKSNKKQIVAYAEAADLNRDAAQSVPKAPPPYHPTAYASVSLMASQVSN